MSKIVVISKQEGEGTYKNTKSGKKQILSRHSVEKSNITSLINYNSVENYITHQNLIKSKYFHARR